MKKLILIIHIFIIYSCFSQDTKLAWHVETSFEIPEKLQTRQSFIYSPGIIIDVPKKKPFPNPIFGVLLIVEKPITKNINIGFQTGFKGTFNDQNAYVSDIIYEDVVMIPIALNLSYHLDVVNKKIKPFVKTTFGYTFMNQMFNHTRVSYRNYGGLSYSYGIGMSVKQKWKFFLYRNVINTIQTVEDRYIINDTYSFTQIKNSYGLLLAYSIH